MYDSLHGNNRTKRCLEHNDIRGVSLGPRECSEFCVTLKSL
ncbi:Uncharacterised protein [Yersinia thracica]|uniref:Uncharacterized protein n=1 Tax=Yersinia thracica TaxID=2890319 RepID=A0A0T9PMD9_9GAMM|nr:Uncharacterised protein [Yersinia thracica]